MSDFGSFAQASLKFSYVNKKELVLYCNGIWNTHIIYLEIWGPD